MSPLRFLLLLLLVASAHGEEAKPKARDPRRLKPDHAPTPYTADQIRDGCRDGRTSTYRIEAPRRKTILQTLRFSNGTDKGCDLEVTRKTEDGTLFGKPTTARAPWAQLQSHASFPEKLTKVTDAEVTTPAGKFDCLLYTVTTRRGEITTVVRAYFAKKLPGPPVKRVVEMNGKVIHTMTLVKQVDGKKKAKPPVTGKG